jgi:hypothetical protein
MKAPNIWTKKFGSDRRLIGIDAFFINNAGRGRRSDIDPPFPPVGIFGQRVAPTRDLRGAPGGSHEAAPAFSRFLDHALKGSYSSE